MEILCLWIPPGMRMNATISNIYMSWLKKRYISGSKRMPYYCSQLVTRMPTRKNVSRHAITQRRMASISKTCAIGLRVVVLCCYSVSVHLYLQYIPRSMHTVFALLCFVVVIHWLIFPYPSGLLHWHCGNLTIAPVPAKQPWWIWINTSCEFIMNDCTTTTKQSTTKPCAYFLGYTVFFSVISLAPGQIYTNGPFY